MKASKAKKIEDLFELREIRGNRVFIVDDHHKAFAAWAVVRRGLADAPLLISFDHHTDTMEAYGNASAVKHPQDDDAREALQAELQAKLGSRADEEVLSSVAKLKHDEHIDAAAICGILRASFSIQLDDMGGWPVADEHNGQLGDAEPKFEGAPETGLTYEPPEHNVFVVGHECFVGCEAMPHTDACLPRHFSEIIESAYVED